MATAPRRGEIVWITLNPQAGHEQAGRRPALVISPEAYNAKVGLALVCPITGRVKGYPFEVELPEGLAASGVVLADQIRCVDWRVRKAERSGSVPAPVLTEVLGKLSALLEG